MAISATALNDYQVRYSPDTLDRVELRRNQYGVLDAFIQETNTGGLLSQEAVNALRTNPNRDKIKIPVMAFGTAFTTGTADSCNFVDGEVNSAFVTPVWSTFTVGFHMSESSNEDNVISYLNEFALKMDKAERAMAASLDTACYNALNTAKSQVYGASEIVGTGKLYPLTNDSLYVSTALRSTFFNDYQAIKHKDNFTGRSRVIGSSMLKSYVTDYVNQGAGNSANLAYQFADYDFTYSPTMTVDAGSTATAFIMPEGSVGIYSHLTPEYTSGARALADGIEFSSMQSRLMPGMQIGVKFKSSCADLTTAGISTMPNHIGVKDQYQLVVNTCTFVPYNSDAATLAGAIHKVEFRS